MINEVTFSDDVLAAVDVVFSYATNLSGLSVVISPLDIV